MSPPSNARASVLSKPQQDSEKGVDCSERAQIISKQDGVRYEDHYSVLAHLAAQLLRFALDLPNSERERAQGAKLASIRTAGTGVY
jgi:hypothetical protein